MKTQEWLRVHSTFLNSVGLVHDLSILIFFLYKFPLLHHLKYFKNTFSLKDQALFKTLPLSHEKQQGILCWPVLQTLQRSLGNILLIAKSLHRWQHEPNTSQSLGMGEGKGQEEINLKSLPCFYCSNHSIKALNGADFGKIIHTKI